MCSEIQRNIPWDHVAIVYMCLDTDTDLSKVCIYVYTWKTCTTCLMKYRISQANDNAGKKQHSTLVCVCLSISLVQGAENQWKCCECLWETQSFNAT